jgi:hypothetical protein
LASDDLADTYYVLQIYYRYNKALTSATAFVLSNSMPHFQATFAPEPPEDPNEAMIQTLISLVTFGITVTAAPFLGSGTYL